MTMDGAALMGMAAVITAFGSVLAVIGGIIYNRQEIEKLRGEVSQLKRQIGRLGDKNGFLLRVVRVLRKTLRTNNIPEPAIMDRLGDHWDDMSDFADKDSDDNDE